MSLKPRTCQLLDFLIEQDEPIFIKDLAEKFNVSKRTIRYDLDDLEEEIKDYNVQLIKKPRVGIYLEGQQVQIDKLEKELIDIHNYQRILSPEERIYLILFRLFQADEPIIIKEFEVMLQISKSTIIKDLDKVEEWLENHNLELVRRTNYGFEINGKEIDIRYAIMELLEETAEEKELIYFLREIQKKTLRDRELGSGFFTELDKIISNIDLTKVENVVSFAEKQLGFQLADGAYAGLLVHLALAISRLLVGKDINLSEERLKVLKKNDEYKIAKKIAKIIEEIFKVEVPASEIGFITLHLMGAKLWQKLDENQARSISEEDLDPNLIVLTKEMVKLAEDYLRIKLVDDTQLIVGLALHLKPTINRIKYDLPLKNPLLKDIKNKYGKIFLATEVAVKILQTELQEDISQDEIGYIALHLGAALERKKSFVGSKKLQVALVCSSGMGTTNLLASRLKKEFKEIGIYNIFSAMQVENNEVELEKIDLIITTIPLKVDFKPVLKVNPLLTDKDRQNIKAIINQKQEVYSNLDFDSEEENYYFSIEELIETIKQEAVVVDEKALSKELKKFFNNKGVRVFTKEEPEIEKNQNETLTEMLNKETVFKVKRVDNWEEGIKKVGDGLVNSGRIKKRYIQKTLEVIKEKGPYVVISSHVALVHARPEDGVIKRSMGLLLVEEGVDFKHKYDPVHLIFMLAPQDGSSHLSALADLLKLLNNKDVVEELLAAKDKKEIIEKINWLINN